MVYSKKFVAVIKCNGQILREISQENNVTLPFGSEYSILLKNLDHRRATAEVSIDGVDVLNGKSLVIDPDNNTELKGVMVNNAVKNAFKFIQKTKKIQDHRGDKIDDGFIRIKFGFEKILKAPTTWTYNYYPPLYFNTQEHNLNEGPTCNGISESLSRSVGCSSCEMPHIEEIDEGITVPGSELKQDFNSTFVGTIEDHGTIIIRLKGTNKKDEPVKMPLFVSTKKECPTCGTKSRYGVKFCSECGTNIQI